MLSVSVLVARGEQQARLRLVARASLRAAAAVVAVGLVFQPLDLAALCVLFVAAEEAEVETVAAAAAIVTAEAAVAPPWMLPTPPPLLLVGLAVAPIGSQHLRLNEE